MIRSPTLVPASYLLFIKDNTILLLRRLNTGWHDGDYSLVAGHVEEGETVRSCAVREAKEDADLAVRPEELDLVHVMHRKDPPSKERIDFFLKPRTWTGEPKIMEPDKCDRLEWFSLQELPENLILFVKQAIELSQKGVLYSEYGYD